MEKYFEDSFDEAVNELKQTIFLDVYENLFKESLFAKAESDIRTMKLANSGNLLPPEEQAALAVSYESLFAFGIEMSRVQLIDNYLNELKALMVRKQKDYGKENILKFKHVGLMVRMSDKIERIKNLAATGKTPENESLADSYADIVNYAIIGTMLLQGTFERPLSA